MRVPGTPDEAACKQYIRSLLCAFFTSAPLQALKLFPEGQKESYESMAMAFYEFFAISEQKGEFYADVVQKAGKGACETVRDSFDGLRAYLKKSPAPHGQPPLSAPSLSLSMRSICSTLIGQ